MKDAITRFVGPRPRRPAWSFRSWRWIARGIGTSSTRPCGHYSGPAQNFVYADVDGNIGYHAAGMLPNRQGCRGDVPADGAANSCEWAGAIPYDDLPQVYNPPSGIIASANQDPFPADYRYAVNGGFAPPYRAREIRTLLSRREKWKPEEMLSVQKDVYSDYLSFLAHQAVEAWDKHPNSSAQMRAAADTLRNWNGQTEKKTAAPMVATLLDNELRKAAAKAAAPGAEDEYASRMAPVVVEKLLRERPAGWFKNYDDLLIDSLAAAVSAGEKLQGSNVAEWDYGQTIELHLVHPVAGELPVIGRYFNIGPVPMSGSSTSIKQTTQRLGPSLRMVVDLSNLDQSQANIVTGESGHVLSQPLQGPVGRLLRRHQLPDAVRQDGRQGHPGRESAVTPRGACGPSRFPRSTTPECPCREAGDR